MLPTFLIERWGYSPSAAGNVTGLVALASIGGSFLYGLVAIHVRQIHIALLAGLILVSTAFPAFGIAGYASASVAFAVAAVFASGMLVAMVFASVPRLVQAPESIGPANGVIAQLGSVGALTGPPLVGYIVSQHGWASLASMIVLFTIVCLVLLFFAERAAQMAMASPVSK